MRFEVTDWTGRTLTIERLRGRAGEDLREVVVVRVGAGFASGPVHLTPEQAGDAGRFLVGTTTPPPR